MSDPADLINAAVEELAKASIKLPAFSTLDRLAGHIRQQVHEELYAQMAAGLTSEQQHIMEALLVVPPGEKSHSFQLPEAGAIAIWKKL